MKQLRSITLALEQEDIFSGPLILVNKACPIRHALPQARLAQVAPGIHLEKQAALLYQALLQKLGAGGSIVPVSGYRSQAQQEQLFADCLQEHGEEYTRTYVALPGCSEHQTGLAIDVALQAPDIHFITPHFPYTGICQRFREMAAGFGFIQRYPKDKQHITGIGHEPWHFRYVGVPHAQLIAKLGLTLEEYTQWVKGFPLHSRPHCHRAGGRSFTIGYVPAGPGITEISLQGEPYTISGNNQDGFVVAVWGPAL